MQIENLKTGVFLCVGGFSGVGRESKKPFTQLHLIGVKGSNETSFVGYKTTQLFFPYQCLDIPVGKNIEIVTEFNGTMLRPVNFIVHEK